LPNIKGIVLAGGKGTRLRPLTFAVSKQLLPVYDKPMIYYPLSVLMLCGIREIAVVTDPRESETYASLLGDGSQWGVSFTYIEQPSPDGLAQAISLSDKFIDGNRVAMILGDNIFYGGSFRLLLASALASKSGACIFVHKVADPENYGIAEFDHNGEIIKVLEKPKACQSDFAITGLYFFDGTAVERTKKINKSARGEFEIVELISNYLVDKAVSVQKLGRGLTWLDAGTHEGLINAGNLVRTLQQRQGLLIGSPDEVSYQNGWISLENLIDRANLCAETEYGSNLLELASQK
jgi:glucose-1-phosphate thymidylyltransferase